MTEIDSTHIITYLNDIWDNDDLWRLLYDKQSKFPFTMCQPANGDRICGKTLEHVVMAVWLLLHGRTLDDRDLLNNIDLHLQRGYL